MNLRRLFLAGAICWTLGTFSCSLVWAGPYDTNENSTPQKIVDGMANKAVRGMANVTTGWLEFPKQIYLTYNEEGPTKGILVGPIKGLGMTIVRTLSGVGEVATFFVSYPGFYDPYFEPAFVWEEEE